MSSELQHNFDQIQVVLKPYGLGLSGYLALTSGLPSDPLELESCVWSRALDSAKKFKNCTFIPTKTRATADGLQS